MNLDELRSVQSKERKKDSLQNLRPSFYQEVGEYIAELEDERERVADQVDDPFSSPEIGRLTDEIETAKDVVEAIYERRMGKLVKQASLAAAGMAANDEGLTAEEADLFDDLVDRIGSNKSRVLDVLEGVDTGTHVEPDAPDIGDETAPSADSEPADTPPAPPQEPPQGDIPADESDSLDVEAGLESGGSSGVTPADVMGGDGPSIDDAPAEPPSTPPDEAVADAGSTDETNGGDDVDRVTVRITQDIGSILGVDDREYTLSTDDVVTLPAQNATPLVEREAAEPLE
ncbi:MULTISPECIES: DNA replication complex subunit Gins51 [Natronorubrum]|uniref:Uncharacterized protein n=2 Tax=Natronorubrum bangense TaxID=61858 RepID=L9WT80_9EURY|nr:hypothetical protein [Natronorubrum bangense]ELY52684.1 hypothetical protein C494_00542 [Natronorubrum bangense JCM 10635]QCC55140.1 hypothetical protein DV706_12065 [Natronorubrum bangense]